MVNRKRAQIQFNLVDITLGLIIIAGGVLVVFSRINFGLLLTSIGVTLEAFKILIEKGM